MFSSVQPPIVSLFSSTGSRPLLLFSAHTDPALAGDSVIRLVRDADADADAGAKKELTLVRGEGAALAQTVLHMQSPTLRTTFVRCPPLSGVTGRGRPQELCLRHPWIHVQVRNLGREWAFEVGVVDNEGLIGVIRCSTFQKSPRLTPPHNGRLALLHLPLSLPPQTASSGWCTLALHLPSLLSHFSSSALLRGAEHAGSADRKSAISTGTGVPRGRYSHVAYVQVYATCRLRRVWLSEGGPQQAVPWEFGLYVAEE